MDDFTANTAADETESVILEMVADGLMEQKVVIAPDGTLDTLYRLTPKGLDDARALILRLAPPAGDDQGYQPEERGQ